VFPVVPTADDGTDDRTLVSGGTGLGALGPDGSVVWQSSVGASTAAVRAGGVAVVQPWDGGTLTGVSMVDGSVLWQLDVAELAARAPRSGGAPATVPDWAEAMVAGAATDGRRAVVALVDGSLPFEAQTEHVLVSIDLRSGDAWAVRRPGRQVRLVAVGGRLFEASTTQPVTLIESDGATSTSLEGTLSLLVPGDGAPGGARDRPGR
jgi:hypothetical protein